MGFNDKNDKPSEKQDGEGQPAEGAQAVPVPPSQRGEVGTGADSGLSQEAQQLDPTTIEGHGYRDVAPGVQARVSTESERLGRLQQENAEENN